MKKITLVLMLAFSLSGCATYISNIVMEQMNKEYNFYSLIATDKRIAFESISDVEASCDGVEINAARAIINTLYQYTKQKKLQFTAPTKVDLMYKNRPPFAFFVQFYAINKSFVINVRYSDVFSKDANISETAKKKNKEYIEANNFPKERILLSFQCSGLTSNLCEQKLADAFMTAASVYVDKFLQNEGY